MMPTWSHDKWEVRKTSENASGRTHGLLIYTLCVYLLKVDRFPTRQTTDIYEALSMRYLWDICQAGYFDTLQDNKHLREKTTNLREKTTAFSLKWLYQFS